ncbi:hypothetical protein NUH87_28605 [Pseudomonas batumici]|uniref:hypothetical protein n=1 Tax=Pseudomonas batumici TaxID=226910 RepID=UPI0030D3E1BA
MKESNWDVLETKNLNLPTVNGFMGENGNLIICNEGDGLAIFTSEMVGMTDVLRGANLLHVTKPEKYAGSWRCVGRDTSRGDAYTPYPLIFTKDAS